MRKPRPPETHFRTHLGRLSVSLTEGFVWVNGSDGWGSRSLTPAQCRRLAAWLLRAADWMDTRGEAMSRRCPIHWPYAEMSFECSVCMESGRWEREVRDAHDKGLAAGIAQGREEMRSELASYLLSSAGAVVSHVSSLTHAEAEAIAKVLKDYARRIEQKHDLPRAVAP